ncbi:MAG TPA: hypothetical protein VGN07_20185 [Steroidobacteraceae bacterium]|jgi:hypothetical protein
MAGTSGPQSTTVWGGFLSAEPLDAVQLGSNDVSFQLPQDTFRHSDPAEDLQISVQTADGTPLLESLHFDPATWMLAGALPAGHPDLVVVFVAQDGVGGEASTRLTLHAPSN